MAGHGAPEIAPIDCHDLRVAVVAASWHTEVMDGLVAGAQRAFAAHKLEAPVVVRVPGTFELPVTVSARHSACRMACSVLSTQMLVASAMLPL